MVYLFQSTCANSLITLIGHFSDLSLSYIKDWRSINKYFGTDSFIDSEDHHWVFLRSLIITPYQSTKLISTLTKGNFLIFFCNPGEKITGRVANGYGTHNWYLSFLPGPLTTSLSSPKILIRDWLTAYGWLWDWLFKYSKCLTLQQFSTLSLFLKTHHLNYPWLNFGNCIFWM